MNWNYLLFIMLLLTSAAISVALVFQMWRLRIATGARVLIITMILVAIWTLTYALEIISPDYSTKMLWSKMEYIGIAFIPLGLFLFGMEYSGRGKWITRPRLIALMVIPFLTLALTLTNEFHGLIWSEVKLMAGSNMAPLEVTHGAGFYLHFAYSYALLLVSTVLFIQLARAEHSLYRHQARIMLAGMLAPWVGNLLYITHLSPFPPLDWTPIAFTITTIALEIGFARYGLMDILPVAQNLIFSSMQDGVIVTDAKNRIVEINPAAQRIFKQHEDKIIGQEIHLFLPVDKEWKTNAGPSQEIDREITIGEGPDSRVYNMRATPVLERRGEASGQLAILTDITEQKKAQIQMRLQSAALEAAENGIVITDVEGKIQWTNPAFTRLTGYQRDEILGKKTSLLKSGLQPSNFYKTMWETILAGRVWHGELVNRRKDNSYYDEEMTIAPLLGTEKITHFIAIKQDITDRKHAEERLRQAHKEAMQANRMKTQLLASVSHDLRTPLGAIMGFAEMLQSGVLGKVNADQEKAATEILDSSNQLLSFVNNLIGQAQLETGRLVLKPSGFKPAELIEGVQAATNFLAHKKGLSLKAEIDPQLPPQINGDAYWLKQILLNLANNAVKFTEKGSVNIRLMRQNPDQWAIQVSDTGIGIPQESQQKIFEPFQQLDGPNMRRNGGSGLGLSIVQQLVNLMGGQIKLQSQLGQGSTFTVLLPLSAE